MLLVLTNSHDATVDYAETQIEQSGIPYLRLDTDRVAKLIKLESSRGEVWLCSGRERIGPRDISTIWLRRPEPVRVEEIHPRESALQASAEWSEALEGFLSAIPEYRWINHPHANSAASVKMSQLRRARERGLRVPETIVTQSAETLRRFWADSRGRVIVKPLSAGRVAGGPGTPESVVFTSEVEKHHLERADALSFCPALFQERIDKRLDVRISIVDDHVHAVGLRRMESGAQILDIRRDNMRSVIYGEIELPIEVKERVIALVRSYGLRFAAVDMAIDAEGNWIFFEINPNGQWAWLDLTGVTTIVQSFVDVFSTDLRLGGS